MNITTAKAAAYLVLTIYIVSLSLDATFAVLAGYYVDKFTSHKGIVNKVEIQKYRATTILPNFEITDAGGARRQIQTKFGSISLRWFFQTVPQPGDDITFRTLQDSYFLENDQIVSVSTEEKSSTLKLWADVFAVYLHSNLFVISWVCVFIAVFAAFKYVDLNLFDKKICLFLIIYPPVKFVLWAFGY